MGDELVRVPRPGLEGRSEPFATIHELRSMVVRHPNLQGIVRARAALDLMRVGSDSAPETLLRLALCDAGLPEPELQLPLRLNSATSPTADLGYRRSRLAVQYDGEHHLLPTQIFSDRRRDKAFEAAGWDVLVLTRADLADGFAGAVSKIKRMLRASHLSAPVAAGFSSAI
jgi:very-short-patch-repair endonuclease